MSNSFNQTLKYTFALLLVAYLGLIGSTAVFATIQTNLERSIHETKIAIGEIEREYYDQVSRLNSLDPLTYGFVKPTDVRYVAKKDLPDISFMGR